MQEFREKIPENQQKEEKLVSLEEELQRAREEKRDIYEVARLAQRLKGEGGEPNLTEKEWQEIGKELEKARANKSQRPLKQGYEIARWLMIIKVLGPEEKLKIPESDIRAIKKAAKEYQEEENFHQLESLRETCDFLELEI